MMALWIVFPVVASVLFGLIVWLTAASADVGARYDVPLLTESRAWRRLVGPLFPGILIVTFLAGWALQEPDPADEWIDLKVFALAAVIAGVVLRALGRALRSVRAAQHAHAPIATVGLFRCRTIVSDSFRSQASSEAIAAALAHEAAHARARDPIRIWLGQLAADLQWPIPKARRRFHSWLLALELRRDDEAVAAGASPTALAESILLAVKLKVNPNALPNAAISGRGDGLALRVRRLLSDQQNRIEQRESRHGRWIRVCCWAAIAVTAALGSIYGDALLTLLPGVRR